MKQGSGGSSPSGRYGQRSRSLCVKQGRQWRRRTGMDCTPDRCVLSEEGNGKAGPAWTALQIDVSLKQGRQ